MSSKEHLLCIWDISVMRFSLFICRQRFLLSNDVYERNSNFLDLDLLEYEKILCLHLKEKLSSFHLIIEQNTKIN